MEKPNDADKVLKERKKSSGSRKYGFIAGGLAAVIACVAVFILFGLTPALILAQIMALPLAFAFILVEKIRQRRLKSGGRKEGWWTGVIVEGKKVRVRVDWNSCMGASSCVELAPKVFRLDWSRKKSVFDPAPLELLEDRPMSTDPDIVFSAAQSCPYHAIILEDDETGERIFPQN